MSTTELSCLHASVDPPVRVRQWSEVMDEPHTVGVGESEEPLHWFPECLHDTIRMLKHQRRSAELADKVMRRLCNSMEKLQADQSEFNRLLMNQLLTQKKCVPNKINQQ